MSNIEQPEPIKNNHDPVWNKVIELAEKKLEAAFDANDEIIWREIICDMVKRKEFGFERYGTYLQPFNGRDALLDAYQEALDLSVYLAQHFIEQYKNIEIRESLVLDISLSLVEIIKEMIRCR